LALFALGSFLTPAASSAQPATTGTIEGHVAEKATAASLQRARVDVVGTNLQVFTNEFGEFVVSHVPAGTATLRVFYTGLPAETAPVEVPAGGVVRRDFLLGGEPKPGGTVVLRQFVVAASRDADAAEVAINEQRFAPNLKNVVATDALGDVVQNNVGEFVKFLPGVNIDTDQMNAVSIGLRGMTADFTTMSLDGAPVVSAAGGGTDRTTTLQTLSLNNASRIEVTKVPTPDMPASSIGGSINLVSRNAFELPRPRTDYRVYANMETNDLKDPFEKQPGGNIANREAKAWHVLPSFQLTHTDPLSKKFGFSINAIANHQYDVARRLDRGFNDTVSSTNPNKPTVANPYLQTISENIFPVYEHRFGFGARLDYKLSPVDTLSASWSGNYLRQDYEQHFLSITTGGNPSDWGPTFTHGGTGAAGSANVSLTTRYQRIRNNILRLTYRHIGEKWDANASAGSNQSGQWYREEGYGEWERTSARIQNLNVNFDQFDRYGVGRITATDATGQPIDLFNLNNYRLFISNSDNNSSNVTRDTKGISTDGKFDLKRKFFADWISGGLKIGAHSSESYRQRRYHGHTVTYVGANGIANDADDAIGAAPIPLADTDFVSVVPVHQFPRFAFPSARKAYQLYQQFPNYWTQTSGNIAADIQEEALGADQFKERIDAGFAQLEGGVWRNRLRFIVGVRHERTDDYGRVAKIDRNAQYQHDAQGGIVLDSARKPVPITTDPIRVAQLTYQRLGTEARVHYSGNYPSLNAVYSLTANLQLRLGVARTLGRPNIGNIIGPTTVTTNDFNSDSTATGSALGTISTKNPNLKPYDARNYDAQLEYYTPQGGSLTAGWFRKNIKNFFGTQNFLADAPFLHSLGLSEDLVDYQVNAPFNIAGTTHITGAELGVNQPLREFGGLGFLRHFRVFANYTRTKVTGVNSTIFRGYNPFTWNGGVFFRRQKLSLNAKYTLVPRKITGTASSTQYGAAAYSYQGERSRVDAEIEYQLGRSYSVFLSGRNIFNNTDKTWRYADGSPDYVKFAGDGDYGVLFQLGVKGTF